MTKRKTSPLQVWRAQYHLLVKLIRDEKGQIIRNASSKAPSLRKLASRAQSRKASLSDAARAHMAARPAVMEAQAAWWAPIQAAYEQSLYDKADQKHDAQMADMTDDYEPPAAEPFPA